MKYIKTLSSISIVLFFAMSAVFVLQSAPVNAQASSVVEDQLCRSDLEGGQLDPTSCDNNRPGFFDGGGLFEDILNILTYVVGAVAVIMIVVSGLMYVLSAGDSNNVSRAKNTLLYAVVGLVIAMLAQGIVAFVLTETA